MCRGLFQLFVMLRYIRAKQCWGDRSRKVQICDGTWSNKQGKKGTKQIRELHLNQQIKEIQPMNLGSCYLNITGGQTILS